MKIGISESVFFVPRCIKFPIYSIFSILITSITSATSIHINLFLGVSSVDFSNSVEAAETINVWVEDNTNHKIKNLLKPADITQDTSIILVNALYFSGKWESEFRTYRTYKHKFFRTKDETVDIDTMYQSEFLKYYENPTLKAKFLELDYIGNKILENYNL